MLNDWFDISDRLSGLMWLKMAANTDKQCAKLVLQKHYSELSPAEEALTDRMVERCNPHMSVVPNHGNGGAFGDDRTPHVALSDTYMHRSRE